MKLAIQVSIALLVCAMPLHAEDTPTGFINFDVEYEGKDRPNVVYVPRDYDSSKAWPLIVFLHGYGERGDDGLKQTDVGIGKAIRTHPERFPCIVLLPQCPDDSFWGTSGTSLSRGLKDATPMVDVTLEYVRDHYNIDPNRITLTGLSMGGMGTWRYGAKRTDIYAAFMPVCGSGNIEDVPTLAKRPIRVFHGGADSVVPPEESRVLVEALEAIEADVKYTEYEGVGHNSWDKAYGSHLNINWLLKQRLDQPAKPQD